MRATLRLLANIKPGRHLEPFTPTGLTGLVTHPSPRPTLIYLYQTTLQKLKAFPESSAYRQSTEALTRHRLQIVEATKPPGFEAWLERVQKTVAAEPERFKTLRASDGSYAAFQRDDGSDNPRGEEWDGEGKEASTEGPIRTAEETAQWQRVIEEASRPQESSDFQTAAMKWENEPALEAHQYALLQYPREASTSQMWNLEADNCRRVSEIENQIGAGLIEEVIQVAENEMRLVDEMYNSKV